MKVNGEVLTDNEDTLKGNVKKCQGSIKRLWKSARGQQGLNDYRTALDDREKAVNKNRSMLTGEGVALNDDAYAFMGEEKAVKAKECR